MVEQRNHNPLVGGPNPSAATRINKRPDGSFFYSVRRCGDGHPDGVRPAGKRQTVVCRSPEVLTKGDLPRGMKRSGINPSAATKIQTVRMGGFNFGIVVADEDPKVRQNSRFCKCNVAKPLRFGKGPAHKVCGNIQSAALLSHFVKALWDRPE